MTTATPTPTPLTLSRPTAPLPPAAVGQVIGFRIMRETEVAPGWWGQPTEVGETGSGAVADSFCREQNKVTMDPNRSKRIMFYADPIYAEAPATDAASTAPLPSAAVAEQHRIERRLASLKVGESTVINGTEVTVIDVATADLIERGRAVSAECRRRSATAVTSADFDALLCMQDELAMCHCLVGGA